MSQGIPRKQPDGGEAHQQKQQNNKRQKECLVPPAPQVTEDMTAAIASVVLNVFGRLITF